MGAEPPRLRPLSPRRSAVVSVLDVGTSKTICLIARLEPLERPGRLRTHKLRILGIGYQRSRGLKGGQIVNMDEAEATIGLAVDAAERMAGLQVEKIIVAFSGGRLLSHAFEASRPVMGGAVEDVDVSRVLESAFAQAPEAGRSILHSMPTGFSLGGAERVFDPRGMIGRSLSARLAVVGCDSAALGNFRLAAERRHLGVSAFAAAPYAAGLAVLAEDEMEMGATVVDFGGGSTSVAVFQGGALAHLDSIALGGQHVTLDVARGMNIRLGAAEKLKCLYGNAQVSAADDRETILVEPMGEENARPTHAPRAQMVRIIAPRIEEILELARDRLRRAGFAPGASARVTLTGGASQLPGLADAARRILGGQPRAGRPMEAKGLPDSGRSPVFSASVGALVYPQAAGREHFEPTREHFAAVVGGDGVFARVGRWLKDSF